MFGNDEMQKSSGERESPRGQTKLVVSLENVSSALETEGNVGLGGFCFVAQEAPAPGTRLDIMVDLPGVNRWLIASGEVLGCYYKEGRLWVRGRFSEIDFEQQRWLARWLDQHSATAA